MPDFYNFVLMHPWLSFRHGFYQPNPLFVASSTNTFHHLYICNRAIFINSKLNKNSILNSFLVRLMGIRDVF